MSILSKLFHHDTRRDVTVACPHRVLVPRWEHSTDIGHEDEAIAFRCEACGTVFAGEAGRRLLDEPVTVGCTQ
jgi:hypothetical protein